MLIREGRVGHRKKYSNEMVQALRARLVQTVCTAGLAYVHVSQRVPSAFIAAIHAQDVTPWLVLIEQLEQGVPALLFSSCANTELNKPRL